MRVAFSSDGCNFNATLMQPYKTVSFLLIQFNKKSPRWGLFLLLAAADTKNPANREQRDEMNEITMVFAISREEWTNL